MAGDKTAGIVPSELEAKLLCRQLIAAVDHALLTTVRDPASPPTDGAIAVMVIFSELEELGYTVGKR